MASSRHDHEVYITTTGRPNTDRSTFLSRLCKIVYIPGPSTHWHQFSSCHGCASDIMCFFSIKWLWIWQQIQDEQLAMLVMSRRRQENRRQWRSCWVRPWLHAESRLLYGHYDRLYIVTWRTPRGRSIDVATTNLNLRGRSGNPSDAAHTMSCTHI